MQSRIAILSRRSLFSEGLATRFGEFPSRVEVVFVEPDPETYLAEIERLAPAAVVIDALETKTAQCCLLCDLLMAFPNLTLIRLEVEKADVQVVSSSQKCFSSVRELIDILAP